jgi:Ca2+-binding EF-hand superfamily protein
MVACGLGNEKPTIEKVFFIFDDKNRGSVDFKELLVGIEVFRQQKTRQLIYSMLDTADIKGRGTCTEPQVSQVLTAVCFKPDEKVRVRNIGKCRTIQ